MYKHLQISLHRMQYEYTEKVHPPGNVSPNIEGLDWISWTSGKDLS